MPKTFTAAEVADAIDSLYKAGITPEQMIDGALVGTLNLAAAGDLPTFRAADATAAVFVRFPRLCGGAA